MGIRVEKTAYPQRNVPKFSTFRRKQRVKLQKHSHVKRQVLHSFFSLNIL